jgi:hypothetical protein
MTGRFPDLFIAGAPRCGTTFLYTALQGHPDVFMSPRKEPRYFAPDLDSGEPEIGRRRVRVEADYLSLFADARPDQLLGEATAAYLGSKVAPRLIAAVSPQARIIVSLRDPVERMVSLHAFWTEAGFEHLPLEEAIEAEPERAAGRMTMLMPTYPPYPRYRGSGRYGEQLQRLVRSFPREQVLVLFLDDLAGDPEATLARVTTFLGIPHLRSLEGTRRNDVHAPRRQHPKGLQGSSVDRAKRLLTRPLRRVARSVTGGRALPPPRKPGARKEELSLDMRDRLRDELREDLLLASRILEVDLVTRWWGVSVPGNGAAEATRHRPDSG